MTASSLLSTGRRLQKLRDAHPGAASVLLGFPGAAGGGMPLVTPPPLIFHSPASLLLHDIVWIPDHVFDLDGEETLATVPYLLLQRLADEGVVRFVPCAQEPAMSDLQPGLAEESAAIVRILLSHSSMANLSAQDIKDAVQDQARPDGLSREQRAAVARLFRTVRDAVFLHGLAEVLQCPYSLVNDDFSIHEARSRYYGQDLEAAVLSGLEVFIGRGSILLDACGRPADLIPEAALIPQRIMQGAITVCEAGGVERPFRAADGERSLAAAARLLSLRGSAGFVEMRKVLGDWQVEIQAAPVAAQPLKAVAERYQGHVKRLLPALRSAMGALAAPVPMRALLFAQPAPAPMACRLAGLGEAGPVLFHLQDHPAVPALSGYSVHRRP